MLKEENYLKTNLKGVKNNKIKYYFFLSDMTNKFIYIPNDIRNCYF